MDLWIDDNLGVKVGNYKFRGVVMVKSKGITPRSKIYIHWKTLFTMMINELMR